MLLRVSILVALMGLAPFAARADQTKLETPLLVELPRIGLDYRMNQSWTLGPTLNYSQHNSFDSAADFKTTTYNLGARANWFANGTFTSGLYVSPLLRYAYSRVVATDVASATVGASVGYSWFWNVFNMMVGAGAQKSLSGATDSNRAESATNAPLFIEYSFGWKF